MKTVFKKGMKVYDQLIFPDKEGIVLTTNYIPEKFFDENYVHPYPIEVEFGSETMLYTSDGDSGMCGLKTLSTKPYKVEFQGFEQKEPKPTYEEAVKWVFKNNKDAIDNIVGFYINKEHQEAEKALRKLIILRNYYNKGYNFEWLKNEYCAIVVAKIEDVYEIAVRYVKNEQRVLFFKSREIANKFLEEQKELLEIAKPLL